jgi:hypothetical protein
MSAAGEPPTWAERLRGRALRAFPPERLLPGSQPAYVSSWVYVFGVLTIASLIVLVVTGIVLVIFGPTWWHVSQVGHFFNSLHLWSAELFFFFMAIHLWAKYFMASWRGRRSLTWVTGALCFLAAIATAFTGYLSQQNFDSQWIATQGKDGLNASGVGAAFNVLDFGQMLAWHILLMPLVLILLTVVHILLVRYRGVCPPFPAKEHAGQGPEDPRYPRAPDPAAEWTGAKERYDLIRELVAAVGAIVLVAVVFAAVFSSPDVKSVTVARWANAMPKDFLSTAVSELDRTSGTATYGPPYTNTPGAAQAVVDSIRLADIGGARIPMDTPQDFVIHPLRIGAASNSALIAALKAYASATVAQRRLWTSNYSNALARVSFVKGAPVLPRGRYGPVATMMSSLLAQARRGGLDGALLTSPSFYQVDYTKPLLFLSDGTYLDSLAQQQNLLGTQWGMMNETGNWPGQAWLWLYTFWYQIPPFKTSPNADAQIWAIMAFLSLCLVCVPFIPVVKHAPKYLRVYRLIWRDYYRRAEREIDSG